MSRLIPVLWIAAVAGWAAEPVRLSSLDLTQVVQDYGVPGRDRSLDGRPLEINGRIFTHGIGTHAVSDIVIDLGGGSSRFTAWAGLDQESIPLATVTFAVYADGTMRWSTGLIQKTDDPTRCDLDVTGVQTLRLEVTDGPEGYRYDHADWAEAEFTVTGQKPKIIPPGMAYDRRTQVVSGTIWRDTLGAPIQAHGGGILNHNYTYYWYGEDKNGPTLKKNHERVDVVGVACYSSPDLLNWTWEGLVLPAVPEDPSHDLHPSKVLERPKVIYHPVLKKFVMWFHVDDANYGASKAGVAVADKATGPFRYLGSRSEINEQTFQDMNLFVDDDDKAYVFFASEGNVTQYVSRLNDDWTDLARPPIEDQTWARNLVKRSRGAPAPFKHAGKYYQITSGCTRWNPNSADLAVADNPLGPYVSKGNPCSGPKAEYTFLGQGTFVLPLSPGRFLFMIDRWKPRDLRDSRYVWLPFTIGDDGTVSIPWADRWGMEVWKP